jgi:phosphoglycolate phosphatase-like HAD superfamily hydrolase
MSDERAAVIEIVERRKQPAADSVGASIVVPNEVRINGQRIAIPQGEPITVHDMSSDDVVKVTLTVFARRIFIGHEDIDETVVGAVAEANRALADAYRESAASSTQAALAITEARERLAGAHRALAAATSEPAGDVTARLERLGLLPEPDDDGPEAAGVSA